MNPNQIYNKNNEIFDLFLKVFAMNIRNNKFYEYAHNPKQNNYIHFSSIAIPYKSIYKNDTNEFLKKPDDDRYIFYECTIDYYGIECKKIEKEYYIAKKNSVLININKKIPNFLHKTILYYSMIPKRITIID